MPFDPTKPVNGSPVSAAELRAQFTSLKALIDGLQTQAGAMQTQLNTLAGPVALLPTTAGVTTAIETLSSGPAVGVAELGLGISDPPAQSEVQDIANKIDEALVALKRL